MNRALESRWLKLLLSAGLLALLFTYIDTGDIRAAIVAADPFWVGAAIAAVLASHALCVERWRVLARPLGFEQSYGTFFGAYFTGMFMNLFAPSTIAGDVGRTLLISGDGGRKGMALASVIAERLVGLVVLVSIGAIAVIAQPQYALPPGARPLAWLVIPGCILGWWLAPRLASAVFPEGNRIRTLIEVDLAPYWSQPRAVLHAAAIAVVYHVLQIGAYVMIARALGLEAPVGFFYVLAPIVNIAGMLPITFGGVGIREAGMLYFLRQVGVPDAGAIAVGLIASGLTLGSGVVGGVVYVIWQSRVKARGE